MTDKEIALQITLKVLDNVKYSSLDQAKSLPYEIYNSIYKNIDKERYV